MGVNLPLLCAVPHANPGLINRLAPRTLDSPRPTHDQRQQPITRITVCPRKRASNCPISDDATTVRVSGLIALTDRHKRLLPAHGLTMHEKLIDTIGRRFSSSPIGRTEPSGATRIISMPLIVTFAKAPRYALNVTALSLAVG